MTGITIYDTKHANGSPVCEAFAAGLKALGIEREHIPMQRLRDDGRAAFFYGVLRGGLDLMRDCIVARRPFLFADHGYVGPRGVHFRITRDARFCAGFGPPDFSRLGRLGIEPKAWREGGGKLLVCPPPLEYEQAWHFDGKSWLAAVRRRARKAGLELLVRYRPDDPRHDQTAPPIGEAISPALVLVTHESNLATEALIEGVPVVVTGEHPARAMGRALNGLSRPTRPDNRRDWLGWLAANQWTLDEFADGTAFGALQGMA